MSDPGFPQAPQVVRAIEATLPGRGGERVQVVRATGALQDHGARETLAGEVIARNKDGSTTIRTEKGDLTVMIRGRDKPPEGARVAVDLPAGAPPRQATLTPERAAPEQAQAQTQAQAPAAAAPPRPRETQEAAPPQQQQPQAAEPGARDSGRAQPAPIDSRTAQEIARQAAAGAPPPAQNEEPPQTGDLVRLLPLPPGEPIDRAAAAIRIAAEQAALQLPSAAAASGAPAEETAAPPAPLPYGALAPPRAQAGAQTLTVSAPPHFPPLPVQATQMELQAGRELDLAPELLFARLAQAQLRAALLTLPALNAPGTIRNSVQGAATHPFPGAGASGPLDIEIRAVAPPQVRIAPPGQAAPALAGKEAAFAPARTQGLAEHPAGIKPSSGGAASPKNAGKNAGAAAASALGAALPKGIAGQGSGVVSGLTAKGLPVLSVPLPGGAFPQEFVMQTGGPAGLLPGAEILFAPRQAAHAAGISAPGAADPLLLSGYGYGLPLPLPGQGWPALQEIVAALQQAAPQAAQALAHAAPNAAAPDKIPAAALLFIAAARAGDLAGWFGERTLDTLRRAGKSGLVEKLGGGIEGSARSGGDRAGAAGEWRALNLPLFYGGEAQRLALYYRHDGGKNGDGGESDARRGTRFIFDLSLNRMGPVQLDGLHRGGRLELIVRTQAPLGSRMQQAMRRAYVAALENTGIGGELGFQNSPAQWVRFEAAHGRIGLDT